MARNVTLFRGSGNVTLRGACARGLPVSGRNACMLPGQHLSKFGRQGSSAVSNSSQVRPIDEEHPGRAWHHTVEA
jgi:hypothetical protein